MENIVLDDVIQRLVVENETVINEVKDFLLSDKYQKNSIRNIVIGKALDQKMMLKQFPEGFSALCEDVNGEAKADIDERRDSGRTFVVDMEVNTRLRRRYKKRTLELWKRLLGTNRDLNSVYEDTRIISFLSKDISSITPVEFREEYYIPLAYLKDDVPIGGNYLHLWEAGTPEAKKINRKSIYQQPGKEFLTGGCMFGVPLYGVDQLGNKHSLTNPYCEISDDIKIEFIESDYETHPDEIQNQEAIENIIPLIKVLGQGEGRIKYHLPTPNYILYGVNWYLKGKMTSSALASYIKIVKDRAKYHKDYTRRLSEKHDIEIITSSTLDSLELESIPEEDFINNLFSILDIDCSITDTSSGSDYKNAISQLFEAIFFKISMQPSQLGMVWKHLVKLKNDGKIEASDSPNLLMVNFLDYSANLALSVNMHGDREVFSMWPSQESPITHWYKKLFAEEFGTAMCIHWLSPLQLHQEKCRDRVFYLMDCIDEINILLSSGLLKLNFLQVAAIALDSTDLAMYAAIKIKRLVSNHQKLVDI